MTIESIQNGPCSWCKAEVPVDDGFRLRDRPGVAVFCRLEHVIPWALQGPVWLPRAELDSFDDPIDGCAQCGVELDDTAVVLVRHRGTFRVPDGFCSLDHLLQWAKAGGRWRTS